VKQKLKLMKTFNFVKTLESFDGLTKLIDVYGKKVTI
jgi:hypothetical protein